MRRALPLALACLALAAAAQPATAQTGEISACATRSYHPAQQPPFGGERVPPLRQAGASGEAPPGFQPTPGEAIDIAAATDPVREEGAGLEPRAYTQGP